MVKTKILKFVSSAAFFFSLAFCMSTGTAQAATFTGESVVTLINQSRTAAGVAPLTINAKLTAAATAKANDMFNQQYFDHIGPDGKGPEDWIEAAGYDWTYIGENIAYGYNTAEAVHAAFMSSPGHKANIMSMNFEHVGVAAVSGTYNGSTVIMVVEEFGSTDASEPTTTTPPTTTGEYTVTVNGGTGGGSYAPGETVYLNATGAGFVRWTGDTTGLSCVLCATPVITMPSQNITLTATYQSTTATTNGKYTLTVNGGTGSGTYAPGETVSITATGADFTSWEGDTTGLSCPKCPTPTFTMPAKNVTITAVDCTTCAGKYTLTVNGGTGSGTYSPGEKIAINATGTGFVRWTGDTELLSCPLCPTPVITMPSKNVTITATFNGDASCTGCGGHDLTVEGGTGSGNYPCGATVTVTAAPAPAGKVFDKWVGETCALCSTYTPTDVSATIEVSKNLTLKATYKDAPTAYYILTVTNGTGDGSYEAGEQITITAAAAPSGKVFDKWTGIISAVTSTASATTTVTMPAANTTITATYKTVSATAYALTVASGTGDGSYTAGQQVAINAGAAPTGKVFYKWIGCDTCVADATSASTTVTMPASTLTVTATYRDIGSIVSDVAIAGGTGGGTYIAGEQVTITAAAAPTGKVFDKWTGCDSCLTSTTSATTTMTVPSASITLIATYKDAGTTKHTLTVTNGSGDGSYLPGQQVTITASTAPTGKVFDKWTGCDTCLVSVTSTTTVATMPDSNLTLTATYKDSGTATTKYALTVTNGSGDGSYAAGTKVTITAAAAPAGQIFDKWIGCDTCMTGTGSITAVMTMPASDITLTATYKTAITTPYTLTVANGTGDASYTPGQQVTITAAPAPEGKVFDKWVGCDSCVADLNAANTTMTMPASKITVTATYKDAAASNLPDGTLVKLPDSPKIYIIVGGEKKWISTPEVFEQMGCKWTAVQVLSQETLDAIADFEDNLIRMIGDYKIYLVVSGIKRHIPNPVVFLDYGFKWNEVKDVEGTTMSKYQDAYLIRESGKEPVYYVSPNGSRKWIPTAEIFNSYNDKWTDIQIVSAAEMNAYPISNLIKLAGSNDVYLIENNVKKRIPDPTVFNKYKLDWNAVITVNSLEFNWYQNGGELK